MVRFLKGARLIARTEKVACGWITEMRKKFCVQESERSSKGQVAMLRILMFDKTLGIPGKVY